LYCTFCAEDVQLTEAYSCLSCKINFCHTCHDIIKAVKENDAFCFAGHKMHTYLCQESSQKCTGCGEMGWVYHSCKICEIHFCWFCVLRHTDKPFALKTIFEGTDTSYLNVGQGGKLNNPTWKCQDCTEDHAHRCTPADGSVILTFLLFSTPAIESLEVRCENRGNLDFPKPTNIVSLGAKCSVRAWAARVHDGLRAGKILAADSSIEGASILIKFDPSKTPPCPAMKIEVKFSPENVPNGDKIACSVYVGEAKQPVPFWSMEFDGSCMEKKN